MTQVVDASDSGRASCHRIVTATHLEHVAVVVGEAAWDATLTFYSEVLGLRPSEDLASEANCFLVGVSGSAIELLRRPADAPSGPPGHIAFRVPESEWQEALGAMRAIAPCLREVKEQSSGSATVLFADPAGNAVQLVRRRGRLPVNSCLRWRQGPLRGEVCLRRARALRVLIVDSQVYLWQGVAAAEDIGVPVMLYPPGRLDLVCSWRTYPMSTNVRSNRWMVTWGRPDTTRSLETEHGHLLASASGREKTLTMDCHRLGSRPGGVSNN